MGNSIFTASNDIPARTLEDDTLTLVFRSLQTTSSFDVDLHILQSNPLPPTNWNLPTF